MSAIAEALVATAVGLAVAIPAVAAYNFYQRHTRSVLGNTDALTNVLLAHLSGEEKPKTAAARAKAAAEDEDD
jgi:biopolymer transport protein ExbB